MSVIGATQNVPIGMYLLKCKYGLESNKKQVVVFHEDLNKLLYPSLATK